METHPITTPAMRTPEAGKRETARADGISLRAAAVVAGLGLLLMIIFSGASFAALESIAASGDAAARNIMDNELLFRSVVCGFMVVVLLDVVVAWALYVFLVPAGRGVAILAAWLRVAMAAVFAAALVNLLAAARLAAGPGNPEMVMMSVDAFNDGWDVALVLFGLHLIVLGYLIFMSGYVPRVLGVLVMAASSGYLIDSFGGFLSASYDANIAIFTFFGEALLMVWLLFTPPRWKFAGPMRDTPR